MIDKTVYCPWQKEITIFEAAHKEIINQFGKCLKDGCPFYNPDSMPHCMRAIAEVKRKEKL